MPLSTSSLMSLLSLQMSLSDNRKVVLRSVDLKSSGNYACEVSAEAPSFASANSEARMEVVCKYLFYLYCLMPIPLVSMWLNKSQAIIAVVFHVYMCCVSPDCQPVDLCYNYAVCVVNME